MSKEEQQHGAGTIDLDRLSLDQLNQLKQQEENRLQSITNRYAELRAAYASFASAKDALQQLQVAIPKTLGGASSSPEAKDDASAIMVPLTASLYVPGKIRDSDKYLVELGTGFYVEKTAQESQEFIERKLKLIDVNSNNIRLAIQQLRQNVDSITIAMQGKLIEIRARQEGQRAQRAAAGQE
jgi:prefoldin alpha subunit